MTRFATNLDTTENFQSTTSLLVLSTNTNTYAPSKGAIRFDGTNILFYDGTSWTSFATAIPDNSITLSKISTTAYASSATDTAGSKLVSYGPGTILKGTRLFLGNETDLSEVTLRCYSAVGAWRGRIAAGSNSNVVIGDVSNRATIGGHNSNLSSWADLYINDWDDVFICQSSGNVAIGTGTPSTDKLYVNGSIRTNSDVFGVDLKVVRGGGGVAVKPNFFATVSASLVQVDNSFDNYGITGVTKNSTGNFTLSFNSVNNAIPTPMVTLYGADGRAYISSVTSTSCTVITKDTSGFAADRDFCVNLMYE